MSNSVIVEITGNHKPVKRTGQPLVRPYGKLPEGFELPRDAQGREVLDNRCASKIIDCEGNSEGDVLFRFRFDGTMSVHRVNTKAIVDRKTFAFVNAKFPGAMRETRDIVGTESEMVNGLQEQIKKLDRDLSDARSSLEEKDDLLAAALSGVNNAKIERLEAEQARDEARSDRDVAVKSCDDALRLIQEAAAVLEDEGGKGAKKALKILRG